MLIPEQLWGNYNVPGWTANGIEPWGLQWIPIGADGNLFFKGFFLVMLGLHRRMTGDDRWKSPFDIVRDGEHTFTWCHSEIAEHLHQQWTRHAGGLSLREHEDLAVLPGGRRVRAAAADLLRGTDHHEAFDVWWTRRCRDGTSISTATSCPRW